jgi:hypothetical protein
MERQSKGSRGLEAYCKGVQGPTRAVVKSKKKLPATSSSSSSSTTTTNHPVST